MPGRPDGRYRHAPVGLLGGRPCLLGLRLSQTRVRQLRGDRVARGGRPMPALHLFGLPPVLPRAANDAVERDGTEPSLGSGFPVLRGVPGHAHSSWRTRPGSGAPSGASPRPRPRTGSTTSIRGCSGHAWLLRLLFSRSDARGAPYLGRGLAALRDRRHHVALFGLSRRGPLARGRSRSGGFAGNRLEPSPAVSGLNAPTCSPHPGDSGRVCDAAGTASRHAVAECDNAAADRPRAKF